MASGLIYVTSLELFKSEISVTRMFCNVTETDIAVIYNIQIRHKAIALSNMTWVTVAEVETGEKPALEIDNDKYLFVSGFLDADIPGNSYLSVDIDTEKLSARDDDGVYRCEMTYKSLATDSATSVARNLKFAVHDRIISSNEQSDTQQCTESENNDAAVIVGVILGITNLCSIVYIIYITITTRKTKSEKALSSFQASDENEQLKTFGDSTKGKPRTFEKHI